MKAVEIFKKDKDIELSLSFCDQLEEISSLLVEKFGILLDLEKIESVLDVKRSWIFGEVAPSKLTEAKYYSYSSRNLSETSFRVVFNFSTALFFLLSFQDPFHKHHIKAFIEECYRTLRVPTKVQLRPLSERRGNLQKDFISILKKRKTHSISHCEKQKQMLEEVLF